MKKGSISSKFAKTVLATAMLASTSTFVLNTASAAEQTTSVSQETVMNLPDMKVKITQEVRTLLQEANDGKMHIEGKKFHISQYFTKAECKKINSRLDTAKNASDLISIINWGIGNKKLSIGMFFLNGGWQRNGQIYKNAAIKGTGVEVSYDYEITSNSFGKISNSKVRYR
ncbi:hypothetical protein P9D25_13110 [Bacillus velezensis]|uniref:hypothetical protein n=1 Tax=Bacillus velezensis TaxID=492670 RepID=UPI002DBDA563|nr:hypothetical protein [Bacillus velezensis]MEC1338595.1 hypothetical protein [Bacillus velezensis]